jgi:hypothetical protein
MDPIPVLVRPAGGASPATTWSWSWRCTPGCSSWTRCTPRWPPQRAYVDPWAQLPVLSALAMAFNMTVPMVLLMLRHHHGAVVMVEMAASMVVPTLAATGLYAVRALDADQVMTVANVAMLPTMLLVMLRRYAHYAA